MLDRDANSDCTPRGGAWLDRALWAAMLLACAVAISKNQADPDFWGHVRYGRDALDYGLPSTATYSYTAEGCRWINHENLSEAAFALGVETIGPGGLLAVKCLFGMGVLGLFVVSGRRRGASQLTIFAVALLASMNLMLFWSMRPQVFSYVLFAGLIALLDWCFQGWEGRWRPFRRHPSATQSTGSAAVCSRARIRWLWLLPPLFAVWANTHGGFVAGYLIFAVYLGCRIAESLARRERAAFGLAAHVGAIIAACGLATALNPYRFGLHGWLIRSLAAPRPEIVEWLPPEICSVAWMPLWLMVAVCLAAVAASRKPPDFTHLVLLCLTLWQALEHRRHIPFFTILFGLWMTGHVQSSLDRVGVFRSGLSLAAGLSTAKRRGLAALACAASVMAVWMLHAQLRQIPVRRDTYPVSAMQYMADQQLTGRLVVTFRWAQYAIAAFGSRSEGEEGVSVAFDGRFRTCYPQEIVDLYFDFAAGDLGDRGRFRSPKSPPVDGGRVLEYGRPDLVLIDRALKQSSQVMRRHRETWVLLYQDGLAQLWGRASKYDDPQSPDYLPPDRRRVSDQPQKDVVAWPALPVRSGVREQLAAR